LLASIALKSIASSCRNRILSRRPPPSAARGYSCGHGERMHSERLEVGVSFDPRRGYYTTASELPHSVSALSLSGLRRRVEAALLPDEPVVRLRLDAVAERERSRRRRQGGAVTRERLWPR
jgi:hypothetical protein